MYSRNFRNTKAPEEGPPKPLKTGEAGPDGVQTPGGSVFKHPGPVKLDVLPWGQMSFWGATVISSLVGAVPLVGNDILVWLWGGYSVGGATLTRFFALHFALPFITLGVAGVHILLVQHFSSNNPLGIQCLTDFIPFSPYYLVKDIAGVIPFLGVYLFFVFFSPNYLGHPDNYIRANPMVTPPHIVPEWYFLPFYAILRCCPDKLAGVALMGAGILVLLVLPYLGRPDHKSLRFRVFSRWGFYTFAAVFVGMAYYGAQPVDKVTTAVTTNLVGFYFGWFLVVGPLLERGENFLGRLGRPACVGVLVPTDFVTRTFTPAVAETVGEGELPTPASLVELVTSVVTHFPGWSHVCFPIAVGALVGGVVRLAMDKVPPGVVSRLSPWGGLAGAGLVGAYLLYRVYGPKATALVSPTGKTRTPPASPPLERKKVKLPAPPRK